MTQPTARYSLPFFFYLLSEAVTSSRRPFKLREKVTTSMKTIFSSQVDKRRALHYPIHHSVFRRQVDQLFQPNDKTLMLLSMSVYCINANCLTVS